jgi:UDP-2,4-diacetamido-2,4,6-trideoxy-beta-L-altropyranose hydrolase
MEKAKALFRGDGGSLIGLGHIVRLMALADILKEKFHPTFAIRNPDEGIKNTIYGAGFSLIELREGLKLMDEATELSIIAQGYDLVILDGYEFTGEYQKILKRPGKYLVCIDDMHATHFFADAVINHAPLAHHNDYSCEGYTRIYLGPEYALLREPFLSATPELSEKEYLNTLFISFGGADPQNLTEQTIDLVSEIPFPQITILTGGAYPHLESLEKRLHLLKNVRHTHNLDSQQLFRELKSCDLAIVPSSTILFEVLAAGTIALSGYYLDNQRWIYEGFLQKEVLVGLGNFKTLSKYNLVHTIENLKSNPEKIRSLRKNTARIFDGHARERIISIFSNR